jgi:hypothetical protein
MAFDTRAPDGSRLMTGRTAAGNSQSTAYVLMVGYRSYAEFTTVASGTGCVLSGLELPAIVAVRNAGASALAIYPPVGGAINRGTVNAPYSLAAGAGVQLWASSSLNWYTTS